MLKNETKGDFVDKNPEKVSLKEQANASQRKLVYFKDSYFESEKVDKAEFELPDSLE